MKIQGVGKGVPFVTERKGSKAGNSKKETQRSAAAWAEGTRGSNTAGNIAGGRNRRSSRRCVFCVMNGEEAVWHTFKVCAREYGEKLMVETEVRILNDVLKCAVW